MSPRLDERAIAERYTVRHLDLHMPDPPRIKSQAAGVRYPGPQPDPGPKAAAPSARPNVARQVAQAAPAPQTLVQPKLPPLVLKEKIPLPTVVLWQMESKPVTLITPPKPRLVMAAPVPPSVQSPNEELKLDRVAITPSALSLNAQPIPPSNTSPVVVQAPQSAPAPPQTTSTSTAPSTPATVVALSDLRKDGPVVLPAANQSASANSSGVLASGRPEDLSKADQGSADKGSDHAADSKTNAGAHGSGKDQGSKSGQDPRGNVELGTAITATTTGLVTAERIDLPRDGQFGAVVVGSSLEETFPEAAELWSGRLAYTVYLHVGLSKSWILQYALPPATDGIVGGNAAHLSAPWPFTIIRPNLPLGDLNADALMVHGIVNAAGRFEAIAVAFPPRFQQTEFLLSSLKQWEFRPASQGGKPTAVEVLLIIPEETE